MSHDIDELTIADRLLTMLTAQQQKVEKVTVQPLVTGRLVRVVGLTLEAVGIKAVVGSLCRVRSSTGR